MILLLGIAGAGKGTQGKLLVEKNGYAYFSTGEMLRRYATPAQQERMLSGELLDDDEIITMVDKTLNSLQEAKRCILDGFPRTIAQTDWLLEQVRKGRFELTAIFNLAASEDVVKGRLLARGRPDDTLEAVSRRFEEYKQVTLPILDHLRAANIPVYEVDATREPNVVHDDLMQYLEKG
jgi:adenylate kinase